MTNFLIFGIQKFSHLLIQREPFLRIAGFFRRLFPLSRQSLFPYLLRQGIDTIQHKYSNNDIDKPGKITPPEKYINIGNYRKNEKNHEPESKLFLISGGCRTDKPIK